MAYFRPKHDAIDKAIWNTTCNLLSQLSWVKDRLEAGDYSGKAQHPIDAAGIESRLHNLLHAQLIKNKAEQHEKYRKLLDAATNADADLKAQEITLRLVKSIINDIRTSGIFEGIPLDQEVPEHLK